MLKSIAELLTNSFYHYNFAEKIKQLRNHFCSDKTITV